jgi:hypothetical protein
MKMLTIKNYGKLIKSSLVRIKLIREALVKIKVLTNKNKVDDGPKDCVEEDGAEVLHEDPVVERVGCLYAGIPSFR